MSTTEDTLPTQVAIIHLYKTTQMQARLIEALLERKVLTWQEMIELKLCPSVKSARVLVAKTRKVLEKFDVEINNGYGTGYFIEPVDRTKISARIEAYRHG